MKRLQPEARRYRNVQIIIIIIIIITFQGVLEPRGGVDEDELGLVLGHHLVVLLDGLGEHVLCKLVLGE